MRRLQWMADEKDRADWDKWSSLLALLNNCHAKKEYHVKPSDMNPYKIRESKKTRASFASAVESVHKALNRKN